MAEAPKGASPVLREIYRQFPAPKPDPKVKGSAKAIKKGEADCKGKTPLEVEEEFIGESDLLPEQEAMVEKLPTFEAEVKENRSFVAGQLAALVYEGTLKGEEGTVKDDELAPYGYQGCIYVLALSLKQQLAPR